MPPRGFVVVGESLVDIVVAPSGDTSEAVGGSPMNVAVGLARLDVPALLITQVGDDPHGQDIAEHLRASGVELAGPSVVAGFSTSTATARLDQEHAATYDFELVWSLEEQVLPERDGLHVGSLGASLEPGRRAVLDLVRQAADRDMFVSFDPNVRPVFVTDPDAAWRDLTGTATLSTLVKASDEDLQVLQPDHPIPVLAAELLAGDRTEIVIVTRGGGGSWVFGPGLAVEVAAPRVEVEDTVGAGDSFMAATLAVLWDWGLPTSGPGALARLDEAGVRNLLGGAMSAAAITCSRRGANPPTRRELPAGWPAG